MCRGVAARGCGGLLFMAVVMILGSGCGASRGFLAKRGPWRNRGDEALAGSTKPALPPGVSVPEPGAAGTASANDAAPRGASNSGNVFPVGYETESDAPPSESMPQGSRPRVMAQPTGYIPPSASYYDRPAGSYGSTGPSRYNDSGHGSECKS